MRLFAINSGQARARLVQAGVVLSAMALVSGCGTNYRPVVTPVNTTGPAAQVTSNVVVVSAPSPTTPGIATIIDYSGDTVLAYAPIGVGPNVFTLDQGGTSGYTINSDGTLSDFPVASSLQAKQVTYTTFPSTAMPVNMFSPSIGLWVADLNGNAIDVFTGFPEAFKLAIPVAPTPVSLVGPSLQGQRDYAISQGAVAGGTACNVSPTTAPTGEADGIETATFTVSSTIPLGKCPVFGVQSSDNRRFFVLNRGDDTITVINSQNNTLDSCTPFQNQNGQTVNCHPSLPVSPAPGFAHAGPVYAEYNAATSQLVVSNYDGNSVSVIDVSMDEYGNDSQTFGTTFTIPVGNNPASVTVLADGSRAYTANQTDGTVSVVNLSSHTLEKTLPVNGHPRTVVSTQNSTEGKVYAASPDSPFLTILRTDLDIVDTTILVQGNIVDVRVATQNGNSGNNNTQSRVPGYGQPCYLPPALMVSQYGAGYSVANCRTLP
jgi:YVTN family beta-propeller protein